jgi:hypothetical protein
LTLAVRVIYSNHSLWPACMAILCVCETPRGTNRKPLSGFWNRR